MEHLNYSLIITTLLFGSGLSFVLVRFFKSGFYLNVLWIVIGLLWFWTQTQDLKQFLLVLLLIALPLLFVNILWFVFFSKNGNDNFDSNYKIRLAVSKGKLVLENIRRGIAIIGAAGSGKTESVVYPLLEHFGKWNFSGIIYDYKDFEITEMAYPIFSQGDVPFQIISFNTIYAKVNPIAPRYLPDEESVNEVSRVLIENLLEQKDNTMNATTRFFNDVVEGLIGGMIWRLKTDFKDACTLPHLIALYQYLDTKGLIKFLSANTTSKAMADAFISGIDSERQTAGVKSTLANAFKKISTQRIFMVLSEDEINLNINDPEHLKVISVVNNPKIETSLSPVIATIIHTITKQMSMRHRNP